ncbi:MAG: hypothetical protein Kow0092_00120 [Deferrisomatales bacterium]
MFLRCSRSSPLRCAPLWVAAVVFMAGAVFGAGREARASGGLLARVDPAWSPFLRSPVPAEWRALVAEARQAVAAEPDRVAQVLGGRVPEEPAARRAILGLAADARYLAGSANWFDIQRAYRDVLQAGPSETETAWVRFMLGNIFKGLEFLKEAQVEYRAARKGPEGPWSAALLFDAAAVELEQGEYRAARELLGRWLERYPSLPGRVLVRYLAGECEAALGDGGAALGFFDRARAEDPRGWTARPQTGFALARTLADAGRVAEAVEVLDAVPEAFPGSRHAGAARLAQGELWSGRGEVARAAAAYAKLLDEGAGPEESREARLRLALLGARHAATVELSEPYPAFRIFYRPRPTLEAFAAGRDAGRAQRALLGLGELSRGEGDPEAALAAWARAFLEFPETPESGRAYEAFVALLEAHLERLAEAGRWLRIVELHAAHRKAAGWVAVRDVGRLDLLAARAYEALGAPGLARELYGALRSQGTRAVPAPELERAWLRTGAKSGDPEALERWARLDPEGAEAALALARRLAAAGDRDRAKLSYERFLSSDGEPLRRLAGAYELEGLTGGDPDPGARLDSLRRKARIWQRLGAAEGGGVWAAHGRRVEGRLQFALGRWAEAATALAEVADPGPADRYFLALSLLRAGRAGEGEGMLASLAEEGGAPYGALAALQLELGRLAERARSVAY